MPCCSPTAALAATPNPAEPLLGQLRDLAGPELDRLVLAWLARAGLTHVALAERRGQVSTYRALLQSRLALLSGRVRIYQRCRRLQAHHVEAFAGYLLRQRASFGLLISTGELTRAAHWAADAFPAPRVQLLAGPDWADDLANRHIGVRSRRLWQRLLDLDGLFSPSSKPGGYPSCKRRKP